MGFPVSFLRGTNDSVEAKPAFFAVLDTIPITADIAERTSVGKCAKQTVCDLDL